MNLKIKYILFISILHTIFIVFSILTFFHNKILFVVSEAVIIASFLVSMYFYKSIFRPFKLLDAGVELLSDKDFSIKFLPVGQPELDKLIEVFNKMIDQLRLERVKTTEKNFFLEKLTEASPSALILLDKKGEILSINPTAQKLFNIAGKKTDFKVIEDLPHPWNAEINKLSDSESAIIQLNGINQYKCYKSYFIDKGVKQTFYIIEELTREIIKAERQSYEKVIRMMSHEVNNCVGAVNSILDSTILFMNNQNSDEDKENIEVLNVAKNRIINLNHFTKKFADLVKIPPPSIQECDIKSVIEKLLLYFNPDFKLKNIHVETNFSNENIVNFDYEQLEIVIVNILKNAMQAMSNSGEIKISYTDANKTLLIENNGEAITQNDQKRLFEPFFTTKKNGQGIGLTLIKEILINHSCKFSLQTREDSITEFRIVF